jgi:hypothetical protein
VLADRADLIFHESDPEVALANAIVWQLERTGEPPAA